MLGKRKGRQSKGQARLVKEFGATSEEENRDAFPNAEWNLSIILWAIGKLLPRTYQLLPELFPKVDSLFSPLDPPLPEDAAAG